MLPTRSCALVIACVGVFAAGWLLARRADAGGGPQSGALVYSGTLSDATGTNASGEHHIEVQLWSAETGGETRCTTTSRPASVEGGRFAMKLPDACTDAVRTYPDLWVGVVADGKPLARTKLAAVPYAVEATHATEADSAREASGNLATSIADLKTKSVPASGFQAYLSRDLQVMGTAKVVFDRLSYDLADEYNQATGEFTPRAAGTYLLNCGFWFVPPAARERYTVVIQRGAGEELAGMDLHSAADGLGLTVETTTVVQLEANTAVYCMSGLSHPPRNVFATFPLRNRFSAMRLR